jgi:hypothetical protein
MADETDVKILVSVNLFKDIVQYIFDAYNAETLEKSRIYLSNAMDVCHKAVSENEPPINTQDS